MSVAIRFPDNLQKKLDAIRNVLDNDKGLSLNLSYYKILKLLIDEAYRQLVLGDNHEDKTKLQKDKRKS